MVRTGVIAVAMSRSEVVLKIKLRLFNDRLALNCERRGVKDNSKVFALTMRKMESFFLIWRKLQEE